MPGAGHWPALAQEELRQPPGFFWGGGVDTQHTLPFGTPADVRRELRARIEVFAAGGGFVFNTIHNIVAGTPIENVMAMFEAIREFQ